MYLILHAFSRRNSGDGLLVDLTLEALKDAGIAPEECALLALDPESFDDQPHVHRAPGEPAARLSFRLAMASLDLAADTISGGRLGSVGRLVRRSKALIAVGGGYLVADRSVRQLGVLFNHMAQMSAAARADIPSIYLPQSIGPLKGVVGKMTQKRLRKMDRLYVRDDLTMAEVGSANTVRAGDLAVLKLAREIAAIKPVEPANNTIMIARDLPAPGDYLNGLDRLAKGVSNPIWAVQADTQGPRSDRAFYQRLGYEDGGSMSDLMQAGTPGVVISVRLHGAIAALLAGRPAIHLAYERKGYGAYEDLGIGEYVHDVRRFDAEAVIAQSQELRANPQMFWDRIRAAAPAFEAQYAAMVADMRTRFTRA